MTKLIGLVFLVILQFGFPIYSNGQNKDEDVRRGFIQSDMGLMVDYGGLTNAYLGNISAT